ncbi:Retrovirus Polyprotein [Phytophthora cinnamomi]|uniref:Retrovirus Polyprotein n=1 Tax=Phytophthora cinnamomi TaxID=4785 RepID=UPI003559C165|nr:Retrovirus Polyprotein [Phytophthora cinnamomi]
MGGTAGVTPQQIVVRERPKSLKLTKFKGLDDTMPVTMWLKTVRAEVRRQAVAMGVQWTDAQLYHEVALNLDGEAKRWFATVMESVPPEEETINTLAGMLRTKYMTQRSGPEVVDLLNARRQMRGERLVDYAQSLREIAERGEIGDDWKVSAFLKGMSSVAGATHVRGHRPRTLDEALNVATPQVGEYGEGYGVGLAAAIAAWDAREATAGRGPLAATTPSVHDKEQSGLDRNLGNVVTGYGPAWGTPPKQPRFDTEGRPVDGGKASAGEWWKAIPPGFQLVPTGTNQTTSSSLKFQTPSNGPDQTGGRYKRQKATEYDGKRPTKTLKIEGVYGGTAGQGDGYNNPALATREGRLRNHERYLSERRRRGAGGADFCFYCGKPGHFARDCGLKAADLAASGTPTAAGSAQARGDDQGNEQRA